MMYFVMTIKDRMMHHSVGIVCRCFIVQVVDWNGEEEVDPPIVFDAVIQFRLSAIHDVGN